MLTRGVGGRPEASLCAKFPSDDGDGGVEQMASKLLLVRSLISQGGCILNLHMSKCRSLKIVASDRHML